MRNNERQCVGTNANASVKMPMRWYTNATSEQMAYIIFMACKLSTVIDALSVCAVVRLS